MLLAIVAIVLLLVFAVLATHIGATSIRAAWAETRPVVTLPPGNAHGVFLDPKRLLQTGDILGLRWAVKFAPYNYFGVTRLSHVGIWVRTEDAVRAGEGAVWFDALRRLMSKRARASDGFLVHLTHTRGICLSTLSAARHKDIWVVPMRWVGDAVAPDFDPVAALLRVIAPTLGPLSSPMNWLGLISAMLRRALSQTRVRVSPVSCIGFVKTVLERVGALPVDASWELETVDELVQTLSTRVGSGWAALPAYTLLLPPRVVGDKGADAVKPARDDEDEDSGSDSDSETEDHEVFGTNPFMPLRRRAPGAMEPSAAAELAREALDTPAYLPPTAPATPGPRARLLLRLAAET